MHLAPGAAGEGGAKMPHPEVTSLTESVVMIRYDTKCYFNVRSKADMNQLNQPHGNDN